MYIAAMYGPPPSAEAKELLPEDAPRQVQALANDGQIWYFTEDSQVGDWLQFLSEGGTVEEYSEDKAREWQLERAKANDPTRSGA